MIEPISKATKQRRINQPVSRGIWQTKRCLIVASETVGDLTSGTGWELKLKVLIFSLVSLFRFCIGLATGHTNLSSKSARRLQHFAPRVKIFARGDCGDCQSSPRGRHRQSSGGRRRGVEEVNGVGAGGQRQKAAVRRKGEEIARIRKIPGDKLALRWDVPEFD